MQLHRQICPMEKIKCPFTHCKNKVPRKDLESHKKECDWRPYKCEYCGVEKPFQSITGKGLSNQPSHYDECEQYPLDCVNKCGEKGIKRKDMSTHQESCPLELLDCPFGSRHPEKKILRKNMERHKLDCDHRPYMCSYCYLRGTYKSITGKGNSPLKGECHYDTCSQYPLECPNKCEAKSIKRKNMLLHRERCPLERLDCPFKYAGCPLKILRKNMDYHCKNEMQRHLLLVAESNQKLASKLEELTRKNEELTRRVEELSPSIPKRARLTSTHLAM